VHPVGEGIVERLGATGRTRFIQADELEPFLVSVSADGQVPTLGKRRESADGHRHLYLQRALGRQDAPVTRQAWGEHAQARGPCDQVERQPHLQLPLDAPLPQVVHADGLASARAVADR